MLVVTWRLFLFLPWEEKYLLPIQLHVGYCSAIREFYRLTVDRKQAYGLIINAYFNRDYFIVIYRPGLQGFQPGTIDENQTFIGGHEGIQGMAFANSIKPDTDESRTDSGFFSVVVNIPANSEQT